MPTVDTRLAVTLEVALDVKYLEDLQVFTSSLLAIDDFYKLIAEEQRSFITRPEIVSLDIHSWPKTVLTVGAAWAAVLLTTVIYYDKIKEHTPMIIHDVEHVVEEAKRAVNDMVPRGEWIIGDMDYYIQRTAETLVQQPQDDSKAAAEALRKAGDALSRDGRLRIISIADPNAK